jgi:hypothetical protein
LAVLLTIAIATIVVLLLYILILKDLLSCKTLGFTKKKRQTPNNQNQFSDIDKVKPTIQRHPDSGGVKSNNEHIHQNSRQQENLTESKESYGIRNNKRANYSSCPPSAPIPQTQKSNIGNSSNVNDAYPRNISKYGNARLHENPSDRDESYGIEKQRGPAIHNGTNMPPLRPPQPHNKAILTKDGGFSSSTVV